MSDDWGDEAPGIEAQPFEPDEHDRPDGDVPDREPGRVLGVDIADLAASLAAPAIRSVVHKAVADAVKEAVQTEVEEALDPTVLEELQGQAAVAAGGAVAVALDALDEEPDEEPDAVLRLGR